MLLLLLKMGKNKRGGRSGRSSADRGPVWKQDRQTKYDSKLKERSETREEELCERDETNEGKAYSIRSCGRNAVELTAMCVRMSWIAV